MRLQQLRQRKGQLAAYEALIIIILMATVGGLGWLYANKPSDATIYQKDSKPQVHDFQPKPTWFGCVDQRIEEKYYGTSNNQINSSR